MPLDIDREVADLEQLTTGQLRERYAEVFGEPARSRHKAYLVRKIAWRLQAMEEGDLSERARRRAEELADDADIRAMPPRTIPMRPTTTSPANVATRDPRLPPPGTAITRSYKGRTIEVRVADDGFEYDGERFESLSGVAKAITGSHVNGFRFFRLGGGR